MRIECKVLLLFFSKLGKVGGYPSSTGKCSWSPGSGRKNSAELKKSSGMAKA